jgi:type IV pilus assembly protein PilN
MRLSVNLATRPFVELRPLFARLRLAMVLLAALAVGLGFALHALNGKAAVARAQMDALKAKTTAFQQERQTNETRMRQPRNMAVLERSRFLNAMFQAKSFSWTAVMMDLERVLPVGVQVTSIEPQITKEGEVNIRLRVNGDRDRAVQLVRNLETSQRFVAPRLSGESAQTAEANRAAMAPGMMPGGVVFDILSGYNPLPERQMKKSNGTGGSAVGESSDTSGSKVNKVSRRNSTRRSAGKTGTASAGRTNGGTR